MQLRPDLQAAISRAGLIATTRGHASITAEHLLCALLEDEDVVRIVTSVGGDLARLKQQSIQLTAALDPRLRMASFAPTVAAIDVLRRALVETPPGRARELTPASALVAFFGPPVSRATHLMIEAGVTKSAVLALLAREADESEAPGFGTLAVPSTVSS
jgi:ATP-dependent Clp protease ATP-binding subunit ClpA